MQETGMSEAEVMALPVIRRNTYVSFINEDAAETAKALRTRNRR
jgi:hypothetical protein